MPSRRSPAFDHARRTPAMPMGASLDPDAMAPPTAAELCERAVQAIWHSLDAHDLVDEQVRNDLAAVLEPLADLDVGERRQRLIDTLRMPNPLDASELYWLTRRLLTLVPELQAAARALARPGGRPPAPLA